MAKYFYRLEQQKQRLFDMMPDSDDLHILFMDECGFSMFKDVANVKNKSVTTLEFVRSTYDGVPSESRRLTVLPLGDYVISRDGKTVKSARLLDYLFVLPTANVNVPAFESALDPRNNMSTRNGILSLVPAHLKPSLQNFSPVFVHLHLVMSIQRSC